MYLAAAPAGNDLDAYYEKYAPVVRTKFRELLDGRCLEIPVKRSGDKFKVKLAGASPARDFIERYSGETNLRRLLTGNFNTLVEIFAELKGIDSGAKIPLSKSKYGIKDKGRDFDIVDDLHAIFHTVLVEEIYEAPDVFDKESLASVKNLSICPYCGISGIHKYRNRHGVSMGYEIEHYLPKSRYPYFAISFYNLFPACQECNGIRAKGVNSPLADDDRTQCLMHPYVFEAAAMHFNLAYDGNGELCDGSFQIFIDYHGNQFLRKGYNDVIPIENRYKTRRNDVMNLWNLVKSRSGEYYRFIKNYGIEFDEYLCAQNILGFEETLENSRAEERYKFKTDILHRLRKIYKSGE